MCNASNETYYRLLDDNYFNVITIYFPNCVLEQTAKVDFGLSVVKLNQYFFFSAWTIKVCSCCRADSAFNANYKLGLHGHQCNICIVIVF